MDNENYTSEEYAYIPSEPEQNVDSVNIYFTPESAQTFLHWGKFLAIIGIIMFGFECLTIIGLPIGIIGIIAAVHMLNLCTDIKSQILTNNRLFAESAGDHMYKAVKNTFIIMIIALVLTTLTFILYIVFLPFILAFIIENIRDGIEISYQALSFFNGVF